MRRALAVAACGLIPACAFDPARHVRPARLAVGMNAQRIASSPAAFAARTSEPAMTTPTHANAVTMSGQFTMATRDHLYVGGEIEAGRLDAPGSNVAGAYGIVGGEAASHVGSVGVELASGWRGIRYSIDDDGVNDLVVQPRVRGQLWLSPQVTAGAAAGASLVGDRSWMAGVFIGVHSNLFGSFD